MRFGSAPAVKFPPSSKFREFRKIQFDRPRATTPRQSGLVVEGGCSSLCSKWAVKGPPPVEISASGRSYSDGPRRRLWVTLGRPPKLGPNSDPYFRYRFSGRINALLISNCFKCLFQFSFRFSDHSSASMRRQATRLALIAMARRALHENSNTKSFYGTGAHLTSVQLTWAQLTWAQLTWPQLS